jgi:hypothetical protein
VVGERSWVRPEREREREFCRREIEGVWGCQRQKERRLPEREREREREGAVRGESGDAGRFKFLELNFSPAIY